MATTITRESAQFAADVITVAIEGGVNYWAEIISFHYDETDPAGATTTIHDLHDHGPRFEITVPKVLDAVHRISTDPTSVGVGWPAAEIAAAWTNRDAAEIDADLADIIVQVAAFGKVIFG